MDLQIPIDKLIKTSRFQTDGQKYQPANEKDGENHKKFEAARKKHILHYNEYAKDKKSLEAISVFSKNVFELDKKRENLLSKIKVHVNAIRKFISIKENNSLLDNIGVSTKKKEQDCEIKKASNVVMISLNQTFSNLKIFALGAINYVDEGSLQKELKDFCELAGGEVLKQHPQYEAELNIAYRERERLETVSIHKGALEVVISEVLGQGYPEKIDFDILEIPQDEENQNKEETRGRPREKSAPLDQIKEHVLMLTKKAFKGEPGFKKYWHFNDRYGWGPNKNQMKKNLIEEGIVSDVDESTILRRIDEAFEDEDL